jgi:hypothetical protein
MVDRHPLAGPARTRPLLAALASLALLAAAGRAAEVALRPVALTGAQAPGTATGVVFASFESPFNTSIPVPLIDDAGQVLYFAFLAGPGVDPTNGHGLWVERAATSTLLARAGDPAPGTPAGTFFHGLPNVEIPLGFLAAGGGAAFPATLIGPAVTAVDDVGIWSDASGTTALVVREDDPVPGAPGLAFSEPRLHRLTAAGESLFYASLRGADVTTADDEALWSHLAGVVELRAGEGDPAPGTPPGIVFGEGLLGSRPGAFPFADFNASGQLLLRADLLGPGVDEFSDEALFRDGASGLDLVLREGDPAPGAGPGVTFGGNSVALNLDFPLLNDLGQTFFAVRLGGAIPTTSALFSDHLGALDLVAMPGMPAPGTGGTFIGVGGPALSDAGRIAFGAVLETGPFPPTVIFWDQPGTLAPLALPGDPIPDRPGATLRGGSDIVGFASSGHIAFIAGLDLPTGPVHALLAATPEGELQTLVASGDAVDPGDGGGLRTVFLIIPGGLSEQGVVSLRLEFTDGSSGLFAVPLRGTTIFEDGFESGDSSAWTATQG